MTRRLLIAGPELFGARIRRARIAQELSAEHLGVKAGLDGHKPVLRIEHATAEPGLFRAAAIAAVLGKSLDVLLAPPGCAVCDGAPPAGFACRSCNAVGAA